MGHNNARFYCLEHPDRIAKGYCMECKSGMCSSCIEQDEKFCPACRRELFLNSDKNVRKTDLLVSLIGGVLGFAGSYLIYETKFPENTWEEAHLMILYFTLFGISLFYTFILYRNSNLYDELGSIPFISFKLTIIVYLASAASLIPVLIYLYKIIIYFSTRRQRRL